MASQKFSLSNAAAGSKRQNNDDQKSPAKKIPKVSEMKMEAPRQQTQRVVTNAPVNICVYKISDVAGDLWAAFKDTPTKLWQVQIEHDARPSITVNILASFNDFLKENARSNAGMPDTVQKLQADAGIKLVMTNQDDPDNVGCFVQYRVAFYVAGEADSLSNFFMLLDSYFQFKAKQLARATPFEVHIYPFIDIDLSSLGEQMAYSPIVHHEPSTNLPLKVFQAQPVTGKRVLTLNFEPESDSELNLVITGNTWNFRDDLEKNGVSGTRSQEEGGQYYRYIKGVDITNAGSKQQVMALTDIFNKQILRVVVDPDAEPDSEVAKFFDELRAIPCMHFA